MKHKIAEFKSYVSTQFNTSIKIVRSDNGGEFINHSFGEVSTIVVGSSHLVLGLTKMCGLEEASVVSQGH